MATLLDEEQQPVDRTRAILARQVIPGIDAAELKRESVVQDLAAQKQAMEIAAQANTRAAADAARAPMIDARAAAQEQRESAAEAARNEEALARVDAMRWTGDTQYQTPYHQAPPEARQHFFDAYSPIVAAKAPQIWNEAIVANTSRIPGIDPDAEVTVQQDEKGGISRVYRTAPAKEAEGLVFASPDAAEAAGFSAEGAEVLPNGSIRVTKMARVDKSRAKYTEAESKSIVYLDRMKDAEKGIQRVMQEGFNPASAGGSFDRVTAGTWANFMSSPKGRQYENEQRNFLAGVLRKDTGAAVTNREFDLYGPMFFPLYGDDPGTVQQKARKRQVAIDAIQRGLSSDLILNDASQDVLPPAANGAPSATPQASNGKPKMVRQNGVIYTLQPDGTYK
jgi:hypothetical protein